MPYSMGLLKTGSQIYLQGIIIIIIIIIIVIIISLRILIILAIIIISQLSFGICINMALLKMHTKVPHQFCRHLPQLKRNLLQKRE